MIRLLACLGVEEWNDDPRFATSELRKANVADLAAQMSELFGTDDFSVWGARLAAAGIPIGHIGRTVDHFEDAQVAANAFLKPISDQPELRTIDSPVRLDGIAKSEPRLAPDIGQHSAAILAELGLSRDEIDRLAAQGAIGLSG